MTKGLLAQRSWMREETDKAKKELPVRKNGFFEMPRATAFEAALKKQSKKHELKNSLYCANFSIPIEITSYGF